MAKSAGAFTGGKLNLKGDKKKPKKKTKNSKHGESSEGDKVAKSSASSARERSNYGSGSDDDGYHDSKKNHHDGSDDEGLTAAEKRSRKFKNQRERKEMEHVVRWVLLACLYRGYIFSILKCLTFPLFLSVRFFCLSPA